MESKSTLNWAIKNVILAIVFVAVLVTGISVYLYFITQHNQTVMVPDMTNMTYVEASRVASQTGINVEVGDSVFVRRMRKGAVFTQNPKPGVQVKRGRMVQLTINAVNAKKVKMPDLVGLSMRQAKAELSSKGLLLGRLIYVSDMATNNVRRQIYDGRDVKAGRLIESGASVDLVVGLSSDENQTYVPSVMGMRYLKAVDAIHDNSLNVTKLVFDKTVKTYSDSLNAEVIKQSPEGSSLPVTMGSGVTLHLSTDITKIVK